jgi:hypothetical protein
MPKNDIKVYALVTLHLVTKEERLTLIVADTYEEAEFLLTQNFKLNFGDTYSPGVWYIRSYNSLRIPGQNETIVPTKQVAKDKGIQTYINDLYYAKDHLCETPAQKGVISRIISNLIIKEYGQTAVQDIGK